MMEAKLAAIIVSCAIVVCIALVGAHSTFNRSWGAMGFALLIALLGILLGIRLGEIF